VCGKRKEKGRRDANRSGVDGAERQGPDQPMAGSTEPKQKRISVAEPHQEGAAAERL